MTDTISINGVDYVPASSVQQLPLSSNHVIVIAPNGWIFVGKQLDAEETIPQITLGEASVVRSWSNGKGIGALADHARKSDYTLDPIAGMITIFTPLAAIRCDW